MKFSPIAILLVASLVATKCEVFFEEKFLDGKFCRVFSEKWNDGCVLER